jgi:hypothetical protein
VSAILLAFALLASSNGLAIEPDEDRTSQAGLSRSKRVLIVTGEWN